MTTLTIDKIDERLENQIGEQARRFGISQVELARRILRDYLFPAPVDDAKNDDAAPTKKRAQVARLSEVDAENTRRQSGWGCLKGQVWMADDFDAPLDDFKEYM
ncbi:hypothetical protein FACS1894139_05410 [Planctomycetales bacterium]|nr:hypothetical protein FACS1894108_12020 [Planctomycetales bacterium]GHT03991.1 hypothetical protein FACS1894139_05410 [Planctomycetales bacterium]